ncbi:MAG TPA: enoyl-CoA hydratase-related protein [Acidimicrobiia bacterium]|nr:enoyl-CoA hydratase-related protein [Acidimicrobiia bacterium]
MTRVLTETANGVARITLDGPETRNAISDIETIEALDTAIQAADADPAVSVLVLTGTDPAFSSGGNVKQMRSREGLFAGDPDAIAEGYRASIHRLPRTLSRVDVATIAAVNGVAVGAGMDVAVMCDLRIASDRARFAEPFVNLGIVSGDGGSWFLPRVIGHQRAVELTLTGRMVEAAEALTIGLVLEVVPHDDLMARVDELAGTIAAKPPNAVRLAKRLLRMAERTDLDAFLDATAAFQAITHHSDAHREAMRALFGDDAG